MIQPRVWLLSALLLPAALRAQRPVDRSSLDALRDSLAVITAAQELVPVDRDSKGSVPELRRALIVLRRAELGSSREPFDQALQTLEATTRRDGDWPYPWYLVGLIQLSMYQGQYVAKSTDLTPSGMSYREAAMRSLGLSIAADSSFSPAADALAGVVTSLGHRLLPKSLAEPVRRAYAATARSPEVSLAAARLAFGDGHYDVALEMLGDYLRRGGDPGMARVEQARSLMALGRGDEAARTYLEGVTKLEEAGRLAYREDLAWIATAAEIAAFDSLPLAALPEWVGRFWRERDALNLRAPNERLIEHLRRWVYVHEHFLLHRPDDVPANAEGFGPQDQASLFEVGAIDEVLIEVAAGIPAFRAYRRTQWEVDDRGVLYMRHGEPTKKVSSVAGPPNESWAYDLPEGRRIFHLLGSRALGTQAATTLTASLPLDPDMLDARADLDSRYAALASRIQLLRAQAATQARMNQLATQSLTPQAASSQDASNNAEGGVAAAGLRNSVLTQTNSRFPASALQREVLKNRSAIAAAVTTDGYPLHYKESLDAIVQVYGVGFGEGEQRRILAVFAVPGRKLTPRPRPDGGPGLLYPLNFRLIALDRATGTVRQMDTTRTFVTRDTLRGEQHLTGLLELSIPPGSYQVRALITQPGVDAGTGIGRDSVEIPASPRDLVLSDLVLGREDSGLGWNYGGGRIPLNPLNAFPKGANADLFYEVGGLVSGRRYTVTMSVRKASDKPEAKPGLQLSFDFTATAAYERVNRGLGLGNLKPEAYLLQVAVTEADSPRQVRRERALNILAK
ncbi:MAG: hypothetical protein ABI742_15060 [Gemmatimonadota bacterium]